jgi:hypothetical protein
MQPNSKKCQSTVHIFRKGKAYFPKWNISDDFKLRRKRAKLFTSNCQPQVIIQTKKIHTAYSIFNPFLFIKNKWLFISSEGISALEKKRSYMFSEGNAAHPVKCESPLQILMVAWRFL